MEIGMVGLGKMGAGMVKRLIGDGHEPVAFDLDEESVRRAGDAGARGVGTLDEAVEALEPPRAVWVMVPHGEPTRQTVRSLIEILDADDVVVDGGNSRWSDSVSRTRACEEAGIGFLDVGVSGGVWGLEEGYCMMIGGPEEAFARLKPVFETLAPEGGYAHVGPSGAGHFVKMIHNGIEYAMLQALGEGFEAMHRSEFDVDLRQVAHLWQHGAVIRSWLLQLLERALEEEGNGLERIADRVDDSGMGRWTVEYAVDSAVPMPAITLSLFERFTSRQEDRFTAKVIAALRNQFGGHAVQEEGWSEEAGAFGRTFGGSELDASNLMIPIVGFLPASDPRELATLEATEEHLTGRRGLVYRYRTEDGLVGEEGAFLLCTFWLAEAWARAGEVERATEVFERASSHANHVGLLSEEVDPGSGALLGNFPQAFSHIGLVNAAWAIHDASPRPPRGPRALDQNIL